VALGKSTGEIAAILKISPHTTRELKSVHHKLDCVTSAQAVSKTIQLGLLAFCESGETMSRRARRNHTPAFKSKVALAAVKGDRTLAQLAEQFAPTTASAKLVLPSAGILTSYNGRRPHASLDGNTPDQAYFNPLPIRMAA
jgi:hypothetical protein